jgi:polysaccharide export outer membrane protein
MPLPYRFFALFVCLLAVALGGCGRVTPPPANLPAPVQSTEIGPGDVFEVSIVGEKEIPKEFRVQPDGTVRFPYLDRIAVAGMEPQQLEDLLRQKLIEKKILVDPQVTLIVKQYNSKRVSIIGAVSKPGSIPWTEGLKIVDAISQAGWFTPTADPDRVILTRIVGRGKTVTAYVSVDEISSGRQPDIPLQAGDTIKVEQRVF